MVALISLEGLSLCRLQSSILGGLRISADLNN